MGQLKGRETRVAVQISLTQLIPLGLRFMGVEISYSKLEAPTMETAENPSSLIDINQKGIKQMLMHC
jgi:hypothetical protein